jgi:hypothetical protein
LKRVGAIAPGLSATRVLREVLNLIFLRKLSPIVLVYVTDDLRRQGRSLRQIAQALNVPVSRVRRALTGDPRPEVSPAMSGN